MDPMVTMRHVRDIGLCSRGARAFAAGEGLDWSRFLREGIPASELEATGNDFAIKAAAMAREEAATRGRQ